MQKPQITPALDSAFKPASLENRAFRDAVSKSGNAVLITISIERGNRQISCYRTNVFADREKKSDLNYFYVERLVKSLLWIWGGWKITISGSETIGEYIRKIYSPGGIRAFDAKLMAGIYEKPFTVEVKESGSAPMETKGDSKPLGGHWDGCRIGFDAGGSDRKVSAVMDGKTVFSEEVVWHPKTQSDVRYHYREILTAMRTAAAHLPRVDAIGISSAGIFINNRAMASSLFNKVPDKFEKEIKDIYINIAKEMGDVPVEVANDGDVTALVGAMDLNGGNVLGIAMGTSEAGGYVDKNRNITGWLNELAFVPVDYNIHAMKDEWSGDFGCGVNYFSQDAVIRLALIAGIPLDEKSTPAEKLKIIQELHANGDKRARRIFETIGCYLGYTLAFYSDFYTIRHVLILGRVTSGEGGGIILEMASNVLAKEFPELSENIKIHLPDEMDRRVGQSVAAASLTKIIKK